MVYMLTYGGGLVGGDAVDLSVTVQPGVKLVLLSQGTTKVFKTRLGRRLAAVSSHPPLESHQISVSTKQNITFRIARGSVLVLLPGPVTCFRDASYDQTQRFYVEHSGSVVALDWITSGRMSMGEEWLFSRYYSLNEILLDEIRLVKDVMLLSSGQLGKGIPDRTLKERLAPYSCYATLFLYGPHLRDVIAAITSRYALITVFKTREPTELIWSLSPIEPARHELEGQGVVVRVAGRTTEMVKDWLKEALSGLEAVVGRNYYKRAFP
ncbi:urease accessory protein UreD [Crepidotus variabilis]|uniref:Urease accessory protein UreD n=1 Tax=Crepidotus variabilis TaxID=179855 RepID=A0A9P6E378_9AGAR|nr:urease accessory protein UreD [Crepidotus variabilis]